MDSFILSIFIVSVSVSKIEYLWERFNALDRGKKGYLVKDDFEQIHELQRNYLADRIIDSFFKERQRYFVIL